MKYLEFELRYQRICVRADGADSMGSIWFNGSFPKISLHQCNASYARNPQHVVKDKSMWKNPDTNRGQLQVHL